MTLAIIGSKGNMARRYAAVCRYLDIDCIGFDVDDVHQLPEHANSLRGILIATPTETHTDLLFRFKDLGLPFLCEKPVSKDMREIGRIISAGICVRMVNQYRYLLDGSESGHSRYDYWNSGKDGIKWDTINIIGLSENPPLLSNISPVWECSLNGRRLKIRDMDFAYIAMLDDFYKSPKPDLDYIEKAHRRVHEGFFHAI